MIELIDKTKYDECVQITSQLDLLVAGIESLDHIPEEMLGDEDFESMVWEAGHLLAQARFKIALASKKYFINTADFVIAETVG